MSIRGRENNPLLPRASRLALTRDRSHTLGSRTNKEPQLSPPNKIANCETFAEEAERVRPLMCFRCTKSL